MILQLFGRDYEYGICDDGIYYFMEVRYPSLSGFGSTFEEAYKDLVHTIFDVRKTYLSDPIDTLSPDAIEFRDYLEKYPI